MSDTILTGAGQADPGQNETVDNATAEGAADTKLYDWVSQIHKDYRIDDLKGKVTPTDFVKHYQGVKKELDTVKASIDGYVKVPGENATPEEVAAYRGKMGLPESADKYEVKIPEDAAIDEAAIGQLKQIAFEQGLSPASVQKLVDFDIARKEAEYKALKDWQKQEAEEGLKLLKERHGDKFDEKLVHAMRLVKKLGGDELEAELNAGQGNNPELINFIIQVSQAFTEDGIVKGGSVGSGQIDLDSFYPSMKGK